MKKKERQRVRKASKLLVSALMVGTMLSGSIMPSLAVEPSAYTLTDVGESGNWNYYDIVNGTKTYYQITPKSGTHYGISSGGTDFSIKSIKPDTASYSYQVTPQGTSEPRVGVGAFTGTIGSEGAPLVFHSKNVDPADPDKGGAVYNHDNTDGYSIYADFVSNTTTNYGGGVRNGYHSSAFINKIVGNFVKNRAGKVGGAIANGADCIPGVGENPIINEIIGNFIGNTANNLGGAIYNQRTIGKITGDFLSNTSGEKGGAIYNTDTGTIGNTEGSTSDIFGNFVSNSSINGGAISNEGTISNIEGDFILNTATTTSGNGGAIYNHDGTIKSITGNFKNNSAGFNGGAIYNFKQSGNAKITSISGKFSGNSAQSGGAIYNIGGGEISNIAGDFESNSATNGGAINNFNASSKIGNIAGNFKGNHADGSSNSNAGAIYNSGIIENIIGDFENNSATKWGGAIINGKTINKVTGNFTKNSATKNGGVVYNSGTINFVAENGKNITFSGNYVTDESGEGGAIFNANSSTATVGLYASADHSITFTGDTTGLPSTANNVDSIHNQKILNINGDGTITPYTGTVNLYNVTDAATAAKGTTNIYGGTVNVKDTLTQKTLNLIGGTLNLGRNAEVYDFNVTDGAKLSLSIPGGTFENYENVINTLDVSNNFSGVLSNLTVDYDADAVAGSNMDKITVGTGDSAGSVKLTSVNVIKDGTTMADGTFIDGVLTNITDNTVSVTSTTTSGGWKYTFTPSSKGVVSVTRTAVEETLAQVIQNPTGSSAFTITTNTYTTNENLGSLTGTGRNFTIYGNGNTLNGNGYEGVTVNAGQTFSVENATVTGFHIFEGDDKGAFITLNAEGTVDHLTGTYTGNNSDEHAGVIFNHGNINNISATFSNNWTGINEDGGAINNSGSTIDNIVNSTFENNVAGNQGGAISNYNATINNIKNTIFKDNLAGNNGGAIRNDSGSQILNMEASFENNIVGAKGGAIYNSGNSAVTIKASTQDVNFTNNQAQEGGAIYSDGKVNLIADGANINFNTTSDSIVNNGTMNINGDGASVISSGTVNLQDVSGTGTTSIIGGTVNANANIEQDIINVKSGATLASTSPNVKIIADGTNGNLINDGTINITGANSRFGADHLTNNGTVNITGANSLLETATLTNNGTIDTVSLLSNSLNNNGNITTSGGIEAIIQNNEGGSITFNGDAKKQMDLTNSGTVNFNGGLSETGSIIRLTQNDGVMNFSTVAINSTINLPINIFSMNGGTVNIADNSINTLHINQLNLGGNTKFIIDVDFRAEGRPSDNLLATNVSGDKNLLLGFNLMNDMEDDVIDEEFPFATGDLKNHIQLISNQVGKGTNNPYQTELYTPIYKYDVQYKIAPEEEGSTETVGWLNFSRNSGYDGLNPSIVAGAVAAQVGGGYLNQLTSYDNAFEHMDSYMNLTRSQRTAMKMLNRYAASGANLPTYNPNQLADESKGIWFKPYVTFEKVNLKGGPNVENTAYGSFVGGDSDLIELKNGWDVMYSAYASYDGSHQHYDGVSVYQNGGHLGGTATLYKGNFFTGLTANAGASVAEASTMYGTDNMTMLMAGIASKTGYNWELLNSKLIVQPSMLLSYSFVNMFDYTTSSGIAINSDPLHAIQIAPGLKFIGNLPHGWQPYIGLQMVWNIMDETKFRAANVNLPQLSTRPYFQYGVGVQKKWGDRFSGYLQAMLRNGGRTGIALSAGFRWALGKDVKNPNFNKTSNSVPELPNTKIELSSANK